ncbi:uncharacterized protein FFUJ_03582 [Fusarium fujikuroi IMI 58289]|uniref:VWFA domain-containing protein n=1 Tax=Gibberella fujikuroi (strain CBS 195.34 / IMI 58289 / NRRL A-6831) TaxID=1279085 RepID=S0DVQ6_GIBF5|nr:uncharacterized protein FFUJ_03582 [Fusarium fujikuroi IMI 58289]CCT66545.1 uncharacterized protein FFUJ_03582 [Fusarium fujikuroi IMI 58289]SCN81319.1 uncharacterized protein FFM5_02766 [Fusarium fujikuroi]
MTSSPDGLPLPPVPDQAPAQEQAAASFRQSKICICVDVSGSTYGPALTAEIKAVKQVCSFIPQSMYENITIIPWNDASERPRSLSQIHTLESGGGTDPNVLLEDPECRLLLQEADFWFLMTDGEIDQSVVRQFARNLTDYGMHGKACIVSVFGEKLMKPSHCNITVGLSVFAVSPHVVFINPTLDYDTNWSDLPFVSYENLTRISVPRAQKVEKDELILHGNTRVNINNLVSRETIDEDLMRQIMLNEDNIKTIALTAKLRGESDKLTKWLDKVDAKIEQDSISEAFGHKDSQLLKDTIAEIGEANGTQVSLDDYGAMGYGAQNAYAFEPCPAHISFPHAYHQEFKKSSTRMRALTEPNTRLGAPENIGGYEFEHLHSLTPSNDLWTRSILLPKGLSQTTQPDKLSYTPQTNEKPQSYEPFTETITGNQGDHLNLAIAGFLKPTQAKDQHILDCPKCSRARAVMTLLLRASDQSMVTKNFPAVNSTSKLVYPLTMGNYPETDIISDTITCDKCAVAMVGTKRAAHKEALVVALPLVSYSKNQDAWLQTVNIATGRRFHRSDLAQVFLSIIFTKIEHLLSESSKVPNLHNALNWQASMIQCEVVLQAENFPHVCQLGVGLLNEVILRNYRDCLVQDKFPLLLSYPLDGFIVTNAALSNSKYSGILSQPKRKSVVLLRFLYHLLENCCAYEQKNGPLQLHAAKTLILLMDDPSGPRSLFKWRSLRAFSFRFDSLQDLQKYLSNHAVMDRYRLSLTAADLLDTPLLTATGLAAFRRLGPLFSWIEREAGNAIAVFFTISCVWIQHRVCQVFCSRD